MKPLRLGFCLVRFRKHTHIEKQKTRFYLFYQVQDFWGNLMIYFFRMRDHHTILVQTNLTISYKFTIRSIFPLLKMSFYKSFFLVYQLKIWIIINMFNIFEQNDIYGSWWFKKNCKLYWGQQIHLCCNNDVEVRLGE